MPLITTTLVSDEALLKTLEHIASLNGYTLLGLEASVSPSTQCHVFSCHLEDRTSFEAGWISMAISYEAWSDTLLPHRIFVLQVLKTGIENARKSSFWAGRASKQGKTTTVPASCSVCGDSRVIIGRKNGEEYGSIPCPEC